MENKVLSIIAPCYNGESYIERFLRSIIAQTYKNIELIIINDGSTDRTEEILIEYEPLFEKVNIKYIHVNQSNTGIGGAINNALKIVTGDYLTWFGVDDFALETYAEELVSFLNANPEFSVVRNDGFIVEESNIKNIIGKMADSNRDKHNPNLFENAILEKNFHFGYSVIRMSSFDKVNPKREIYPSRQGQNWQLLLPIFYHYKSAFYEKPLYCVVENKESVSRTPHKSYKGVLMQNKEYEKILTNVINSMNIEDKNYYLNLIKIKYIRRRMRAAFDFGYKKDVMYEFENLKKLNKNTLKDNILYLRTRSIFFDKLIKFIKHLK